jgi:hypothetical protein
MQIPITSPSLGIHSLVARHLPGATEQLHALAVVLAALAGATLFLGLVVVVSGIAGRSLRQGFPTSEALGQRRTRIVQSGLALFWYGILAVSAMNLVVHITAAGGARPLLAFADSAVLLGLFLVLDAEKTHRTDGDQIGFPRWPERARLSSRYSPAGLTRRTVGFSLWGLGSAAVMLLTAAAM